MQFNIEKGIEPVVTRGTNKLLAMPLKEMVSGDSFFVPETFMSKGSVASALSEFRKKNLTIIGLFTNKVDGGTRIFKK
jgi:hypothetical protein